MPVDLDSLNTCCFKALKHNQPVCPVCGTILFGGHREETFIPEPVVLAKKVMDRRIEKIIRRIKLKEKE